MPDVDAQDEYNCTALLYASRKGYTILALKLLDMGADMCMKSSTGDTPVHMAASCESHEYVFISALS